VANWHDAGQKAGGEAGEGEGNGGRDAHGAPSEMPVRAAMGMREGRELAEISSFAAPAAAPEIRPFLDRLLSR
jgi:hypothetical protein